MNLVIDKFNLSFKSIFTFLFPLKITTLAFYSVAY
jgi:hypothetical protein